MALPRLPLDILDRLHHVHNWEWEGLMTMERLFENWSECACISGFRDHADTFKEKFAAFAVEDDTGTKRLDEAGMIALLRQHNVFPPALQDVEPIFFQCAYYFVIYPFRGDHPPTFTPEELKRVIWWLGPFERNMGAQPTGGGERDFSKADVRRLLFQSLSGARNGAHFPFDEDEWRRESRRRTMDGTPRQLSSRPQSENFCYNEWGDELYHDLLDVLMGCQPPQTIGVSGEIRDVFRPFAARVHAGAPELREFTVSLDRVRAMVRLCLYHKFAVLPADHPLHAGNLEPAVDSIMRAFPRDPEFGMNWPMFEEGCKAAPCLFWALGDILETLWKDPRPLDEDNLALMHMSAKLFTAPIMRQLSLLFPAFMLGWFDTLFWTWYREDTQKTANVLDLVTAIKAAPEHILVMISGRDRHTEEEYFLGLVIPCPGKDGDRIQPKEDEDFSVPPVCSLLELRPAQGIYPGTVESPAWTLSEEELSFGDPNNGVALVLHKDLAGATFIQNLDGEDEPIYNPTQWRGNRAAELEIDAIEIALYVPREESDSPLSDDSSHGSNSDDGSSQRGSDHDQPALSPAGSGHE